MPSYVITYLDIRHTTRHSVLLDAESSFIAVRLAWDLFIKQREAQRYGTPLKDDYAVYSVVETEPDGPSKINSPSSNPPDP